MDLVNETGLDAAWTLGFQPDGRELLVVAVKASYRIPQEREEPSLTEKQVPLTQADEFTGEPGSSATRYESDYAHHKPFCDVLLIGSAYAPRGKPTTKVTVGLTLGPIRKRFHVIGDRFWDRILFLTAPTPPAQFVRLSFSYNQAYGGTDKSENKPDKVKTYLENPVGVGYYPLTSGRNLAGKPLPNSYEIGHPATSRKGKYRPMAFGPVSRNFKFRIRYAGTYDKAWLEDRAPFWPEDFDHRYFQAAPPDQQAPYLAGGEEVVLHNLTPEGTTFFRIPRRSMPIIFLPHHGREERVSASCDTLVIEPDERRFTLTWRAAFGLRRNMFELKEIIVGDMPRSWHRARREEISGKPHYANLEEAILAKQTPKA